jgi:hypothetical protein
MLLIFILIGLFFTFRETKEQRRGIRLYVITIAIYFLYLLLRAFVLNKLPVSAGIANFKFYGPPVLFFFVGTMYAFQFEHLKRIWGITFVIGIIVCLYGFKQLYFGYATAEQLWYSSVSFSTLFIAGIARPFSFLKSPAAFADYSQIAIIAGLILWAIHADKRRIFILIAFPFFFYAALITSVRSSWIGILATFFVWIIFIRVKGGIRRGVVLAATIVAYMVYEMISDIVGGVMGIDDLITFMTGTLPNKEYVELFITERTGAVTNPFQEHSFVSRLRVWKWLWVLALDPLTGFVGRGIGALKADSIYFTYLAELGFPGFFFIIWIQIVFIVKGFRIIDNSRNEQIVAMAKGVTVMNIVFALINITGTHIHSFPGDIYFWFWNGVIIMLAQHEQDNVKEKVIDETAVDT